MHERSLASKLLRQVEAIRQQHGGATVVEVRVEAGPLSGVEPLLLASAFEELATDELGGQARLVIDHTALEARCQPCHFEFEIDMASLVFRCPKCDKGVQVTRGDRLELASVTLDDAAQSTRVG